MIVGRELSRKAIDFAVDNGKEIFVTAQKTVDVQNPTPDDIFLYGTRAVILQTAHMPNGTYKVLIEGTSRSCVQDVGKNKKGFLGGVCHDLVAQPLTDSSENQALWRNIFDLFKKISIWK